MANTVTRKRLLNQFVVLILMVSLLSCFEIIKMNTTLLSFWYDELAICMIKNPNLEYPQALEYCWEKWPRRGFYSLPTEGSLPEEFLGHCCTLDMPLADRGFDLGY